MDRLVKYPKLANSGTTNYETKSGFRPSNKDKLD